MTAIRTMGLVGLAVSMLATTTSLTPAGEIVWWTPNWGEARARELADKFMAANPGITVNMEITTSDGLPQRILTALQSGAPPDIMEVQHGWVNGYAQNDLILTLDDVIEEREDYTPAALDYVSWDGKLWAIPYRIETHGVIYNRGHYAEAGLDPDNPPATWDELVPAAEALSTGGRFGFAITGGGEVGNTIFRSLPFIWQNGGGIVSYDLTTAIVNEPAAVEAVTFYTDFYTNGLSPTSTLENDGTANRRLFIAEAVSTYQSGQFDIGSIRAENPNIDIGVMKIPAPEGKDTAAILGGWSYVVPKDARNPDEAKLFLQFSIRRRTRPSSPTPSRPASPRWTPSGSTIRSSCRSRRCCPSAGRCRSTRTGCRSPRPISTASSVDPARRPGRRKRWTRRTRRSRRARQLRGSSDLRGRRPRVFGEADVPRGARLHHGVIPRRRESRGLTSWFDRLTMRSSRIQ